MLSCKEWAYIHMRLKHWFLINICKKKPVCVCSLIGEPIYKYPLCEVCDQYKETENEKY